MLKLSVRMKNGSLEIKAGQSVNANLSVLIRGEKSLSVETAERSHIHSRVVWQHVKGTGLMNEWEKGERQELFVR